MSNDWKNVPLGNVSTLQRGFDLPTRLRRNGSIPIVTSAGVEHFHNEYRVAGPGVVTGRYGTIGEVHWVKEDFWPLNTTLYVSNFHNNDPRFIYFLLQRIDFDSHSGKSGVPGVNRNDLHKEEVLLPTTKAEQEAIAEALSDADDLIESLEKLIAKKRLVKQGSMQELLTGERRLPGFEGEWEEKCLSEIGAFKNGVNKDSSAFGYGFPFINLLDVFGVNAIESIVSLDLINSTKADREIYDLKQGDTLFIRSSVKPEGVGLTAVIDADLPNTIFSGFLIRFRDSGQLHNDYKKFCFYETNFRKDVMAASSVSANTNINQNNLGSLTLNFPKDVEEQAAIARILKEMEQEIEMLEERLNKAGKIKQGMMQQLLTGQIRLI